MDVRKMVCINCPLGCSLEVKMGNEIEIKGNKCKRGYDYALSEVTDPRRIITSTVKVHGGDRKLVSVKTDREISKKLMFDVMKEINNFSAEAPVSIGDILIENILGTEVNIIATSNAKRVYIQTNAGVSVY